MGCRGPFEKWGDRRIERNELLLRLAKILHRSVLYYACAHENVHWFNILPSGIKARVKNPVYEGFKECLLNAVRSLPGSTKLHMVCELSTDYSVEFLRLFNRLRSDDVKVREGIPALTFSSTKRYIALQAADMYASCRRQEELKPTGRDPVIDQLLSVFGSRVIMKT